MTAPAATYDDVPYESYAYPRSHPGTLATIATLFGMNPRLPENARVLELGCAGGGNLLPAAAAYPEATFVGIDVSPLQIAEGQAAAAETGLRNISFHTIGLEEMGDTFGSFDYIIAHGLYSWVAAPVREQLMALCARLLTPQGVAYISFNALPGARSRFILREMAHFHTRRVAALPDRVAQSRALFSVLETAFRNRQDAHALALNEELSLIAGTGDFYLAHEHLEDSNEAFYLHEFLDHARGHGLQFLGDAEIQTMSTGDFPPAVRTELRAMASTIEEAEQYNDFIRNRAFRQTLLCRADVPLRRAVTPDTVRRFHFATSLSPAGDAEHPSRFLEPGGVSLEVADPLARAALTELRAIFPACMDFETLLEKGRQHAGLPAERRQRGILANALLGCYSISRAMEFHRFRPAFINGVSGFPAASPFARWQATKGTRVVNQRHENIFLKPEEQALLPLLDGTRDLATLLPENPEAQALLEHFAALALLVS